MVMASFDIENLFTNIPVKETIDICIRSLFQNVAAVKGIAKNVFQTLLELAVLNSYFYLTAYFTNKTTVWEWVYH